MTEAASRAPATPPLPTAAALRRGGEAAARWSPPPATALAARVSSARPDLERGARGRPVRRPRPRLDGHLCREPEARWRPGRGPARGRGPPRRDRAADPADRLRRIPRPARRRHPDVAERDRAPGRPRPRRRGSTPSAPPTVAALIADGNSDAARARLVELMLAAAGRRQLRRHRPRRRLRDDPRPVPPLRRRPGGAARPRLAPAATS